MVIFQIQREKEKDDASYILSRCSGRGRFVRQSLTATALASSPSCRLSWSLGVSLRRARLPLGVGNASLIRKKERKKVIKEGLRSRSPTPATHSTVIPAGEGVVPPRRGATPFVG